ncbi:MAG: hypothetical protein ABI220_03215 [Candidatus Saccharimonadales bacterium]
MTLTNHMLTGAVLGKFLPWPVAVPLAFISHFVLDASPHFWLKTGAEHPKNRIIIGAVVAIDIISAVIISIWLITSGHISQFYIGLVAYSPDLPWIYRFAIKEKFGKLQPSKGNRFIQFHMNIQKYERPWGIFVEVLYGATMFMILLRI